MNLALPLNFLTEFGCGFVLLACLSRILNFLGMLLMLVFCFRILHFGWRLKGTLRFLCDFGGMPRIRFSLENIFLQVSKIKIPSLENGSVPNAISLNSNVSREKGKDSLDDGSEGKDDSELEGRDEDTVFDIKKLRKLVKIQRKKANVAVAELEQEQTAASSSAEEAMAMIHRLQNEKSAAEIQANQFRRMAEQKLEYDDEVIESLQWTITRHESHRSVLEEQLRVYREELKQFIGEDEVNQIEAAVSKGRSFKNNEAVEDEVVSSSEDENVAVDENEAIEDEVVNSFEDENEAVENEAVEGEVVNSSEDKIEAVEDEVVNSSEDKNEAVVDEVVNSFEDKNEAVENEAVDENDVVISSETRSQIL
ncbi:hypothetical protein P8452_38562 [Trifolium repens]|nr:protein FLOURY [Trifolium repens]WJX52450.1 hypothetical protein P8452_38562 [Trifolium repens]